MEISNLDYYVKFVINVNNKDETFATTDVKIITEHLDSKELKIGQNILVNGKNHIIKDIYIKHVKPTTRDNKIGIVLDESPLVGDIKETLLTIVITVE